LRSLLHKSRTIIAIWLVGLMTGCEESTVATVTETPATTTSLEPKLPRELHDEGYVGSQACADCHERNHASWYASYHRRMTQAASPAAILAPFEDRTPVDTGAAWELEHEGEAFFATPVSRTGDRRGERMRVVLTTGSHHYQMYWLQTAELGGLLALPFAWHLGDRAWVPRRSLFLTPPEIEPAFEFDRWQKVCIACHTTNGTPEHQPSGAARVAEFGISCEACHGPGAGHVALRRELEQEGVGQATAAVTDELIVDPSTLSHERSAMICGQCHGVHPHRSPEDRERWRATGHEFRPGENLAESRELLSGIPSENSPELASQVSPEMFGSLFWSDGEVRVSGREYNGLVESPCFQRGELSCLSCHRLHPSARDPRPLEQWATDQLEQGMEGSRACTQCHHAFEDGERLTAHTHHEEASTGSECMNCHMPFTTYGLTKAIRSHTITVPRADVALSTGRPNACNGCHLDRSLGWSADHLTEWFGHARPLLESDDENVSAAVKSALAGDAGQRALVAWALGWSPAREVSGTGWMPYVLSTLLVDRYDAVARVALATARLDPRYADLTLDFTLRDRRRAAPVQETIMADWMSSGLKATLEQRRTVLIRPDGSLDTENVIRLMQDRDERDVRLAE
jgi:hypothetical protein